MISVWFDEDQRANIRKVHVLKEIGLHLLIVLTILHSIVNTNMRMDVSNYETISMHFH
jgi:hypothetical protein